MKTILILLPVFVSALFAVSTQVRDTAYGPIQQTLADRPADTLPLDNIGDPSWREDAQVAPGTEVSEAAAVREPEKPKDTGKPKALPASALLDVPFASQAPYEDWRLPYKEACEETSIIMVQYYLQWIVPMLETVRDQIIAISDYESAHGYAYDLSIADTAKIAREFYGLEAATYYDADVTVERIKSLIAHGSPVIIPALGRDLDNPHFRGDGPPYHMIVVVGYDETGFVTHDPGTKFGEGYHYSYATVMDAIHDWTGSRDTLEHGGKAMLVLTKKD